MPKTPLFDLDAKFLLEELYKQYKWTVSQDFENCPVKLIVPLYGEVLAPYAYVNFMSGTLSNEYTGTKEIYVHELSGEVRQNCTLYSPDGVPVLHTANPDYTYYRCGLMAALCMKLKFGDDWINKSVGCIGYGKINKVTLYVLYKLGWKGNFEYKSKTVENLDVFKQEVILSCTNSFDLSKRYSQDQFEEAQLFISQDGAWTIDFDYDDIYTDHPYQMVEHWEMDIPDSYKPTFFDLTRIVEDGCDVCMLHGIAISDAVILKYLYDKKKGLV